MMHPAIAVCFSVILILSVGELSYLIYLRYKRYQTELEAAPAYLADTTGLTTHSLWSQYFNSIIVIEAYTEFKARCDPFLKQAEEAKAKIAVQIGKIAEHKALMDKDYENTKEDRDMLLKGQWVLRMLVTMRMGGEHEPEAFSFWMAMKEVGEKWAAGDEVRKHRHLLNSLYEGNKTELNTLNNVLQPVVNVKNAEGHLLSGLELDEIELNVQAHDVKLARLTRQTEVEEARTLELVEKMQLDVRQVEADYQKLRDDDGCGWKEETKIRMLDEFHMWVAREQTEVVERKREWEVMKVRDRRKLEKRGVFMLE